MAGLTELTPQQLLMLQQMGLLGGIGDMSAMSGGGQFGPTSVGMQRLEGPNANITTGNIGGQLPFEGGSVSGGVGLQRMEMPGSAQTMATPSLAVNYGPLGANYGAAISPQGTQHSVGGTLDLGPAQLGYTRAIAADGMPGANMFSIGVPVGNARLNAGMVQGDKVPTSYSGGVTIPGLLGGDLEVMGRYAPDRRDLGVFGRFQKRF